MLKSFLKFLAQGNRPLRILLFGGIFLAWLIMIALAAIFDIDRDIGGDITLPNVVLIMVSMFSGFGIAFTAFWYLEKLREDDDEHYLD